jgi:integrase/recombinase XerD
MGDLKDRMRADLDSYGLRTSTREQYLRHVELCAQHFHRSPDELGTAEIEAYLDYLTKKKGRTATYLQPVVLALKFFYFVTVDRPQVAARFLSPKKQAPAPDPLSSSDLHRLLADVSSPLHQTVLTVSLGGGLGLSEACRLEVGNIDSKRMLIRLNSGNSSWPKFVPLHRETLKTLREWWRDTRPPTARLFTVEPDHTPLTFITVKKTLRAALQESGFQQPIEESVVRYSFFLDRLSRGARPNEVMHLLRQTSIRHIPERFLAPPAVAPWQTSIGEKGTRI